MLRLPFSLLSTKKLDVAHKIGTLMLVQKLAPCSQKGVQGESPWRGVGCPRSLFPFPKRCGEKALASGARSSKAVGIRLLLGLLFSTAISLVAYRRHSLNRSGIAGAIVTGTTTFGPGGWSWGLALIFFFVSSSLLSHYKARSKAETAADKFSKGGERDIGQVAANGGVATLLALANFFASSEEQRQVLQAGYVGSLAAANADTWATELGVLSSRPPRLITTGKHVAPGTSGAITALGTGAAALGALALGLVFWTLERCQKGLGTLPLIALISGLGGSIVDSIIGATLQAMYYCPLCQKETERRVHNCGTRTQPLRGISWFDNDWVNFVATLSGALLAMTLQRGWLIRRDKGRT